jgi:hypothetical protein
MAFGDPLPEIPTIAKSIQPKTLLPTPAAFPDDLLNQQSMAAFLKMSVNGFRLAVLRGHLPNGIDYGAGPRWSKALMFKFIYDKAMEQVNARTAQKK